MSDAQSRTTDDAIIECLVAAIHDALGGNGWAYSDDTGDEMQSHRPELEAAARVALAIVREGLTHDEQI